MKGPVYCSDCRYAVWVSSLALGISAAALVLSVVVANTPSMPLEQRMEWATDTALKAFFSCLYGG